MGAGVKKEVEDGDLNKTAPRGDGNAKSAREEDVTLAQLSSLSPTSPRPRLTFSLVSPCLSVSVCLPRKLGRNEEEKTRFADLLFFLFFTVELFSICSTQLSNFNWLDPVL